MRKMLFSFAGALVPLCATLLISQSSLAQTPQSGGPAAELAALRKSQTADSKNSPKPNKEEMEFISRVNAERKARGLVTLQIDPLLTAVARAHSREMCSKNYFDHHSPTAGLVTPLDRYLAGLDACSEPKPTYALVGENIYYCSTLSSSYSVAYAHQALMKSVHHRENILEPRYEKIGVGTFQNSLGEFWVTELFLRDVPEDPAPVQHETEASPAGGTSVAAAP
jgi:uncharacterized protein YkwD